MCDYAVLHYGQETGLIIEADSKDMALEQIAHIGFRTHNTYLELVEL